MHGSTRTSTAGGRVAQDTEALDLDDVPRVEQSRLAAGAYMKPDGVPVAGRLRRAGQGVRTQGAHVPDAWTF
ncbi:hypothetical protein [Geodermatophilus chilensis]|uniref:hypothetical protein n=1 Tax=Geodermatophilus chilensis TaxID=2035835 RepID=UPI000C25EA43|nr:hypothetical protein [Geodermatophilus chilensis]